ncbi:MAG: DUF397 domain-containing protein [Pseudonocardia sp.]|uniref:DUF397 domain-containing protein n=1 Tax=unclassified Pseudonocardia TaxID=2619320 RepID=UPI00086CC8E5|nr:MULTISPECIES: DUF397 domain-containing protein [unclassified Pseudonocardia]MBN9111505.1 DUF397 domain-containing protein [Pseudonocardia sp.]ODU23328.1 MAG: DUF397 domain-containing protein [Pseudonocardia sp. SCN 72-51]ODV02747.1 MAG: DUF397 domain-containing protein [Pseudonocardia sp. SCN 73-27]
MTTSDTHPHGEPVDGAAWLPATALPDLAWRRATASNPSGDCVEVAALPDGDVALRNSRAPHGPALVYTRAELAAFVDGVRGGEFDDLAS